jgi:hypothetical protein
MMELINISLLKYGRMFTPGLADWLGFPAIDLRERQGYYKGLKGRSCT